LNQPEKAKPSFNGGGFTVAATFAPGIALMICFLGAAVAEFSFRPGDIVGLVGGLLFLLLIVSFWGLLPSLVFGGLVLTLIQRFWPGRPDSWVFVAGGVLAASLYVIAGVATHRFSPGAAMFFAPWTMGEPANPAWWVWGSLVLSGLCAGLIYAVFVKRG